jgi:hypothetical protein
MISKGIDALEISFMSRTASGSLISPKKLIEVIPTETISFKSSTAGE